jgi:thiamine biosynthesis lipoprotein ApbE
MSPVVDSEPEVAADWSALGCAVRLVVTWPSDLQVARDILVAEIDAMDLACSRFRPDSELSRIHRLSCVADWSASAWQKGVTDKGSRPVATCTFAISPLLAEAVGAALDVARLTDGDVDPTVGSAMEEIGYDRDFALIGAGADRMPVRLRHRPPPGWQQVGLDRQSLMLQVPPGLRLDLGATAKALLVDRAAALIGEAIDGRGVLVAIGGDVAVAGTATGGAWTIRVQDVTGHLESEPEGPSQLIGLTRGGLATSSTAARRWVRGGRLMHHIVDPRSGVPVASPWRTVSVSAASCLFANAASTAAIVRGSEAVGWLIRNGLPARLVDLSGAVTIVAGWPAADGAGQ